MFKTKKIVAAVLSAAMVLSLAACGNKEVAPTVVANNDAASTQTVNNGDAASTQTVNNGDAASTKKLTGINIGSWWVQPYDSDDKMEDADDWVTNQDKEGDDAATLETKAFNRKVMQLKWDNVKKIEEKFGFKYYWQNLTYTGTKDSINQSIIAGTPDCELYLVDTSMGIPAQLNGLAVDLKKVLPADADIFTNQNVIKYLDLGDGKASIIARVSAEKQVEGTYPLGFNMQLIEDAGLEDPRVLWEKGEWNWDTFIDYCETLTKDTDGDGQIDQWGYCGYQAETFSELMMSNGANVAAGTKQTLDSPETIEVLQMYYDMYNTYNVCYPYDFDGTPSDSMRNQYTQGNIAFFPIAAWIAAGNKDYDYGDTVGTYLDWNTAYVRWPVGPHGDKDTNAGKNATSGEYYIIPEGVAEPEKVYEFLYDYWNWFDGDTTIRDDKKILNWWYGVTSRDSELQDANFEVMNDCGLHTTFDLWSDSGVNYNFYGLMRGEITPSQFAETYKNEVQAFLDGYFK
ncbi:MAG: hypothetical protein K6F63_01475 [Lachnospiraceae bacterium]|nr:hypothetical protein [Lachnospiraceae bacterium]